VAHPSLQIVADKALRSHYYWIGVDVTLPEARVARRRKGAA
jgi:hypothetical protein